MSPEEKSINRWRGNMPFPKHYLTERDFVGDSWDWVAIDKDRTLLQFCNSTRLAWAESMRGEVIWMELVDAAESRTVFRRYGWSLSQWSRDKLAGVLPVGAPYDPKLTGVFFGIPRSMWRYYPPEPQADGSVRHLILLKLLDPLRRVLLSVRVDSEGLIASWQLLENEAGYTLYDELRARK